MSVNAVMIVPTGLGCTIGGHAGDATPAARLLASVCGTLVLHPNVVNASDICEIPDNALYVEGSQLNQFLRGERGLRRSRLANRILVLCNSPEPTIVNGVNAARATAGYDATLCTLNTPLRMFATFDDAGRATGEVHGVDELVAQVEAMQPCQHDAVALVTPIEINEAVALRYCREGGVNPWGGVEARASAEIASRLGIPTAHAPFIAKDDPLEQFDEVCDPRMAAEMVSRAYLFCIMKGLHRAPQLMQVSDDVMTWPNDRALIWRDIDALVSPVGCWGPPHVACAQHNIPVVFVRENRCVTDVSPEGPHVFVENYLEAAGLLAAMGAGVDPLRVRYP